MPIFFLIFILIPIAELALLIQVGSHIGLLWTILCILLTAIIGVSLLRIQGINTLMKAQSRLQTGELPATELAEGFILALAGALLLTPGFITDAFGFLLLVPIFRGRFASQIMRFLLKRQGTVSMHTHTKSFSENVQQHSSHHSHTIEGEFRRED